jgi:hypothetical protein
MSGVSGKPLVKQEARLLRDYGGSKGKWTKRTQDMVLDIGGQQETAEVHFYYEPTLGCVEQKAKKFR